MIKNIVFDLGNVLISFKPAVYLDKMGYSADVKNLIIRDVLNSQEWGLIDNGDITTKEAIIRIAEKSQLKQQEIASFFNLRTDILYPIDINIKLLPALKKSGFKLYFLSNFPDDIFDEIYIKYNLSDYFSGGLISARVKASKPDRKIFEILIEKYSLDAKECLFIDDIEQNIKTAVSMGMEGIWLPERIALKGLIEKKLSPLSEVLFPLK